MGKEMKKLEVASIYRKYQPPLLPAVPETRMSFEEIVLHDDQKLDKVKEDVVFYFMRWSKDRKLKLNKGLV
ncbi:hypothetical protein PIB30_024554 [Stylosanthes scabra]|uniref:Uncharacterized protein n=1 Tax=Stylosanthes scabra TaxID=79078 RepID=A0ABU6S9T4_9FABA|nr:hypothetical protein [Stylosanthes scabra]